MTSGKNEIPFDEITSALLDNANPFPARLLQRFTDLEGDDLQQLKSVWPQVNAERRLSLLTDLEELAEMDTLMSFDSVARHALSDADFRVRAVAVRLLWETNDPRLIPQFLNMLYNDPSPLVRAAAATALGIFIYLGELEEIKADDLHEIEESLLTVFQGKDEDIVRRRVLESLGFSSRKEVPPLIQAAYEREDPEWKASSLFAMGRSADSAWEGPVLASILSADVNIQFEAVRAAGQLELKGARQDLIDLVEMQDEVDEDVFSAAIWSLSQIGGEGVSDLFEYLMDQAKSDEEEEYYQEALDNLEFTDNFRLYGFMDVDSMDPQDLEDFVDLDGDESAEEDEE